MEVLTYWDDDEGDVGLAVRIDGLWVWDSGPSREHALPTLRAYRLIHWQTKFRGSFLDKSITRLREIELIDVREQVELELLAQSMHNQMTLLKLPKRKKPNLWAKICGTEKGIDDYLRELQKDEPW
jgi:hypothetical protein